ncbi:MAG: fused MFS/spermidine synthase [Gammaproteobacteria bacterium]|nr:fused MFS/spermidine synthase [Gammaproteobacteria bacterium]MBU1506026.1 fused MFS/spermidine synthase [Gammaproteobacteria bacterium]MBU2123581.1 fused MFS/spermidine synthase [Gammaproteobacteria bacterium]MBU2169509.1 fused MFS/spermidine synthase [Gammaproteobacteria bacterium]MBU2202195.1 fused MFS/spermidine synthase [Gammaproteobacteria bacterium]
MTSPFKSSRLGLLAIFVISGFAGLIYQSIWSHYLGLFLGHAAYAQALVLAIFMGGMAAGAAWIAQAGQHWRNLIQSYAVIEAIIGVLGLLFHWVFTGVAGFSYDTLIPALGSPLAVDIARWSIAALLILPQTILLGMTFPLMSGGLIRRYPGSAGNLLGGLYFTNSIGAAIGALAAVFVLLPWVGLPGAMVTAGILNFVVAALAWWLAREPEPAPAKPVTEADAPGQSLRTNPLLRFVLFGTALSGAASFAYEIIWIRMLSMAVGSTMHAFELMLASFIAGIALGGLWVRKHADKTDSPLRLVGWMQVFMGIAALASLFVYANAFTWVGWLMQALAKSDGGYALFNLGTATIAIAIMLPAAFFAGTTLPLFTVALLRAGQGERAIGRVYAWNTLGAILGVFAAIHLLIPVLGLKLALCVAAIVDIGIGLFLLRAQAEDKRSMLRFAVAGGLAATALVLAVRVPFDPMTMASGVFRHGRTSLMADDRILYYQDGKTSSVSVVVSPEGGVQIATNGKIDASIAMKDGVEPIVDEPTMTLAAALPLAMHADPKRIGVIGFGSGLTTHTLLGDSRVERVDTIEIEEAMVVGAQAFGDRVKRAYTDPRSRIVIDDAKSYFAGQKTKYDIIVSEPSNPWISGIGALFSKEFYKFVPTQLNENGLFVQWIQLYEIDESLVGSILNAMSPAFDDYSAWLSNYSDLLIVASPKGPLPKLEVDRLMAGPLKAELARLGIGTAEQLNFRKVSDGRLLRAFARTHSTRPANSDYFPILGLNAPKTRYKVIEAAELVQLPIQPLLFLEALKIRAPLPAAVQPTEINHFLPEIFTRRARALAADLRGELTDDPVRGLLPKVYEPTILLRAAVPACGKIWSPAQTEILAERLLDVAEMTISYLPGELLKGVWIEPKWHQCEIMPDDFKRTFKMLDVMARRDYPAVEHVSREWLEKTPENSALRKYFAPVALSNILVSLARDEKWEDVISTENVLGSNVASKGAYLQQRLFLKAMAVD